jgi:hypothetical protein
MDSIYSAGLLSSFSFECINFQVYTARFALMIDLILINIM